MANTKDFKVKNGIKPTAYHEAVGTIVSGTIGYGIGDASYTGKSFTVSGQETQPYGVEFKPDGTKMYISGAVGDDINQYTLSTAWDVSTATFDNVTLASGDSTTVVVRFNNDGTKLYVNGAAGDAIRQFSLTTAYDISTATFDSVTFSLLAQDSAMLGWIFKPDGTKIYAVGNISDAVYQYSLSTAWDISTASYDSVSFSVAGQDTAPAEVLFNDAGTEMYVLGRVAEVIYVYQLSTAWDISTAAYSGTSFSLATQQGNANGAVFGSNGEYLYVVGWSPLAVHQYSTAKATASLDLSTGSVFEITPTSDIKIGLSNPADSGTVSAATLLLSASGTAYTITYDPDLQWSGGTAPTSPAIGETDVITFNTDDGGTTYKAVQSIDGAK